ncbi:MAG TPA: hypothetical protein VN181_14930, partial [Thermoanaerobaculia bacterium]|nr:hypothetical protein [Thermoanaerobaculia bacterium]
SYEAQRAIAERLAFDGAAAIDTEDAWLDYLERWGSDRHASAAKQRLEAARSREETAWAAASEMKTAGAWQAYLEEFPDGNRSARAETNRREALAFEQARAGGRAALEQFLRGYPNGLLAKEAKRHLRQAADDDDFEHARSLDTVAAWTLYLTTYPNGVHREAARDRQRAASAREEAEAVKQAFDAIARGDANAAVPFLTKIRSTAKLDEVENAIDALRDRQSWEEAERNGSGPALQAYLQVRPNGLFAAPAREKLSGLGAHDADWDAAWEAGSSAAWDVYLQRHPYSVRIEEAQRCRREAAEFELAQSLDTAAMWRAFVKAWPDGRHRLDAEVRARTKK